MSSRLKNMKLKVIVDNNTYIDKYYLGEPGVCYYIEDSDQHILFDTGYSDILISNARKMDIDLSQIETIIFSHGHNDHTKGFTYLREQYDVSQIKIITHPFCFLPKRINGENIGAPYDTYEMRSICRLEVSTRPVQVSERIWYLGEIPSYNEFETRLDMGEYYGEEGWKEDYILDDTAIAYKSRDGLFIITGCSHSGICNIIEHAKHVCNESRIVGIIGGFHMFNTDYRFARTIEYFKYNNISQLYPCHCVSLHVKAFIHNQIQINEVGVGLTLEI